MWRDYNAERGIIIACDSRQEWLLPWFLSRLRLHNPKIPVRLFDNGIGLQGREHCLSYAVEIIQPDSDLNSRLRSGWWVKPEAILAAGFKHILWLDNDCEIRGDLTPLFAVSRKKQYLAIREDKPARKLYASGVHRFHLQSFNAGVISVSHGLSVIYDWYKACSLYAQLSICGDQDVLSELIVSKSLPIIKLAAIWNNLRLEPHCIKARIKHHTGPAGKDYIRKSMQLIL